MGEFDGNGTPFSRLSYDLVLLVRLPADWLERVKGIEPSS
jgi:hypothetical protein